MITEQLDLFNDFGLYETMIKEVKLGEYCYPIDSIHKVARVHLRNGEIKYVMFHNRPHKYSSQYVSFISQDTFSKLIQALKPVEDILDFRYKDGILLFYKNSIGYHRFKDIIEIRLYYSLYGDYGISMHYKSPDGNGGGCISISQEMFDFLKANGVVATDETPYSKYRADKDINKGIIKYNCAGESWIIPFDLMLHLVYWKTKEGKVIKKVSCKRDYAPDSILWDEWVEDDQFEVIKSKGIPVIIRDENEQSTKKENKKISLNKNKFSIKKVS